MSEFNPKTEPENISISKSRGVKVTWKDGHTSEYALKYLRKLCPCATCTGTHGTPPASAELDNPLQMYKPVLKIDSVEPIGGYALRIHWNDGHSAGLYSYEHFRKICPCPECSRVPLADILQ